MSFKGGREKLVWRGSEFKHCCSQAWNLPCAWFWCLKLILSFVYGFYVGGMWVACLNVWCMNIKDQPI